MTQTAKDILRRVEAWPPEDQEELAEMAREIEARRTGVYRLTDADRRAIEASLDDVRAGRFASDAEIGVILQKARLSRA